jgi:anti-sigma factor RsiW
MSEFKPDLSRIRVDLLCKDVVPDIVAFHRGELAPLRAESIRAHMSVCVECRETAFELQIAERTMAKIPDVEPPIDLVKHTLARTAQAEPEAVPAGSKVLQGNFLFRPIRSPVARWSIAVGFMLFAVLVNIPSVAEAIGRVQSRILGEQVVDRLENATHGILARLFM